jgi:phage recombination protein Bet
MNDENAIRTIDATPYLSGDQIELIKKTIAVGATDNELALFIQECNRTRLDPFARQIYSIKRGGKMVTQVSIDGLRIIADRTKKYAGQLGPFWCGDDGKWVDVWLENENPVAARVGVLRKDFEEPLWSIALWKAYAAQNLWKTMGPHMLAKCAEAGGLRKAFPHDMSNLYTSDEMEQAGGEIVEIPHTSPTAKPSVVKATKKHEPIKLPPMDERNAAGYIMVTAGDTHVEFVAEQYTDYTADEVAAVLNASNLPAKAGRTVCSKWFVVYVGHVGKDKSNAESIRLANQAYENAIAAGTD